MKSEDSDNFKYHELHDELTMRMRTLVEEYETKIPGLQYVILMGVDEDETDGTPYGIAQDKSIPTPSYQSVSLRGPGIGMGFMVMQAAKANQALREGMREGKDLLIAHEKGDIGEIMDIMKRFQVMRESLNKSGLGPRKGPNKDFLPDGNANPK